ncbi:MAG TPA: TolC family protein, partial [Kofleriaceae bacterium]|nr:TolC family protein [Kofleriaceae bacterium]
MPSARVAIVVAAAFAPGIVRAQPAPVAISLQQAITYARAHQPSIAAARGRIEVARANAEIPRAALAPRVTGAVEALIGTTNNTTASYATVGIVDVARVGGTPANAPTTWRPEPSTFAGVAVHQEIYDFGRIDAQADALDAVARSTEEVAKVAQLDLDLVVEESFYAVLGARAVLAASEAAVTRARAHRDFAQARVTAKLLPPIEVTRSEADLARFEVERVRAAGGLAIAQAVLAAA